MLVVDHEHRPVDDFTADKFRVKAGTAPAFAPLSMRKQQNDPISLSILIDASRDSFHDLHEIGESLAAITASAFLPTDRISVYALDCALTRCLLSAPPDAAVLQKAVNDATSAPALHNGKTSSACGKTVRLWDYVADAINTLSHQPGRRVLILISPGQDAASKYDWITVQQYAFDQGVAIFGLRDQRQADADTYTTQGLSVTRGNGAGNTITPTLAPRNAQTLELLCANSGGLTLSANPQFRKDAIADLLFLVRSRMILTLPAASIASPVHAVKVTLPPHALLPQRLRPHAPTHPPTYNALGLALCEP